ncbi:MAG: alpha/beta hydrolase [Planctomycetes bacterium]|nr:alpha/beta hydrolase [Planctomycetota bacterium]
MNENMTAQNQICVSPARAPGGAGPRRVLLELDDGYLTPMYIFAPAGEASGPPVVYAHGIQSHPLWFFGSASALAAAGRAVYLVTRRGSGENTVHRGHCRSAAQLLDDVETACKFAMRDSASDRVCLLGVSWGGKLMLAYALNRPDAPISRLILVAPGIYSRHDVSGLAKMRIALALLTRPAAMFDIPLGRPELFTSNEQFQQYLRDDSLSLLRASARFLYASRTIDRMISRARPRSLAMPVLLMLAADDRIIFNRHTESLVGALAGSSCEVITLGGSHTLEFEANARPFFDSLVEMSAK